jgi:hypothetical protein
MGLRDMGSHVQAAIGPGTKKVFNRGVARLHGVGTDGYQSLSTMRFERVLEAEEMLVGKYSTAVHQGSIRTSTEEPESRVSVTAFTR